MSDMPAEPESPPLPTAEIAPSSASENPSATKFFSHLRLHTEFSISDGLVTIKPLISQLRDINMPAVAITDLANLFGLIKFYSSALQNGIKPVCGCDVLVENEAGVRTPLVLLVQNAKGYLNLTCLISELYTNGDSIAEPVLPLVRLEELGEGLIALSGAQKGDIGLALLAGDEQLARECLERWTTLFPNRFYLELQRVGKREEEAYISAVVRLALDTQCPVVATNDVRFLKADDFDAHEVRVCINERRTLDDPRRPHNYTDQQYLKSAEEMAALFVDIPEAISNAGEIVKRCNLELKLGEPCLPNYPVPQGMTMEEYFAELSREGLEERLLGLFAERAGDEEIRKPYFERLDMELGIINQMGFPGYFLIVMEFIQWAKDNDIPVGPGRGSGAGSIVAYALKITDLDPLKYDLLFERFLNPERVSMPDFDVDFCMEGRDRVIQHVAELYGYEAVSQIITFGTMAAKAVVRDVARVQGKPYALADKLSKLIPFVPGMTLSQAFEEEPQLGEFVDNDEDAQEIMEMAYKLEGITRNVGKHAGGVVIAPTKLTDFTPLYCDEAGQGLVTQFDKNDVETAGLVKFDFLGLRTLTIIDWAVKMINAKQPEGAAKVDINTLPLNDPDVFQLLKLGETTAVFQLESRGMKDLIKRLVPSSFEDIIALVALFRPGPLQSGMVDDFIDRKHGRKEVVYPHPELEPVLGNTYGVILYQEQVMQIAQVLANYTLGGADILRKAMGKKKPEEMAKQRVTFTEGALARDIDQGLAESIFDLMEKFAGYGFNKSHSAAYALVSYQTAWLKAHYPAPFMAAVMSSDMQNTDKVVIFVEECRIMGIPPALPDVNTGEYMFTVNDEGVIIYGLGAIKGVGEGPIDAIVEARQDGKGTFKDLFDFCERVGSKKLNKRVLESLVRSGAVDSLGPHRAALWAAIPAALKAADQAEKNQDAGMFDLFGEAEAESDRDPYEEYLNVRKWTDKERLSGEKDTLGLYVTGHPIDEYEKELRNFVSKKISEVRPARGRSQKIAGLIIDVRVKKTKRGDSLCFVTLDDRSARMEATLYGDLYDECRDKIVKDTVIVMEGEIAEDHFNGGLKVKGNAILSMPEARARYAEKLQVKAEAPQLSGMKLKAFTEILQQFRGNQSLDVAIDYSRADAQGVVTLGPDWRVAVCDDLIIKLTEHFGEGNVKLLYQ